MEDIVFNVTFTDSTVDKKSDIKIYPNTVNRSTSLALHGRGSPTYGSDQWTNMVRLLENFCSTNVEPQNPTEGQLWYNASSKSLSVYTKTGTAYEWKSLYIGTLADIIAALNLSSYLKLDGTDAQRTMVGSIKLNRSKEFAANGNLIPTDTIVGGNQNDAVSRSYVDTKVANLVLPDITNLLDKSSTNDQTITGKVTLNNQNLSTVKDATSKVAVTKGYVDAALTNLGNAILPTGLGTLGNGLLYSNTTAISYTKGNSNTVLGMNSTGTAVEWKTLPTPVTLPTGLSPVVKGALYGSAADTLSYNSGDGIMAGTSTNTTFAINYIPKGNNNTVLFVNNAGAYEWQSLPAQVTLPTGLSPIAAGLLCGSSTTTLAYKSGSGIAVGTASNGTFDVTYITKGTANQSLHITSDGNNYEWKTPVALPSGLDTLDVGVLFSNSTAVSYSKGTANTALVMNSTADGVSWKKYLPDDPTDATKSYILQLNTDATYSWAAIEENEVKSFNSGTTYWNISGKYTTISGRATTTPTTLADGSVYHSINIDFGTATSLSMAPPYTVSVQSNTPLITLSSTDPNYDVGAPGVLFGVTTQPRFSVSYMGAASCIVECIAPVDTNATPRWDVPTTAAAVAYTITGVTV